MMVKMDTKTLRSYDSNKMYSWNVFIVIGNNALGTRYSCLADLFQTLQFIHSELRWWFIVVEKEERAIEKVKQTWAAAARVSLRIWTLDQTNQKKALNKLPDAFTTAATVQLVLRTLSANHPLIHVSQPKTTERPEKADFFA